MFVFLLVPTAVATGGYWLHAAEVGVDTRWRVVRWVSIGIVVACLLDAWAQFSVALGGGAVRNPWSQLTTLATAGSAIGFVAGVRAAPVRSSIRSTDSAPSRPESGTADTDDSTIDASSAERTAAEELTADRDRSSDLKLTSNSDPYLNPRAVPDSDRTPAGASPYSFRDPSPRSRSMAATDEAPARIPRTAAPTLDVLRDDRARVALAIVSDAREPLSVDDLAAAVAERTDERAAEVAIGLRHATLYDLAAAHAIEWDPAADAVAAPEHAIFQEGVREVAALLEPFEPGTR